MSPRKFVGKTSREVLQKIKQALGPDALIVSNRPHEGGIEVMAMASSALDAAVPTTAAAPAVRVAPPEESDSLVQQLMREVMAMKSLLQRELSDMAWTGLKQRAPARAAMMQTLIHSGFSPLLARELVLALPEHATPSSAHRVIGAEIKRQLRLMSHESLVTEGGVYALVGPTGVGKTTTVAKLAARCVVTYGASCLGLITTDSYRIAAHDQLRVYGKILNVPVHAVKDAADMVATLSRLRDKKTVLIDTVGMSQRDQMVAEQTSMLAAGGSEIKRLLLLNATANAATLDEVIGAYAKGGVQGCVITKLDESASLGTALDCAIRHQLMVHYVTNGQSVPEDIRLPNAEYLLHRALRPNLDAHAHDLQDDEFSMTVSAGAAYG